MQLLRNTNLVVLYLLIISCYNAVGWSFRDVARNLFDGNNSDRTESSELLEYSEPGGPSTITDEEADYSMQASIFNMRTKNSFIKCSHGRRPDAHGRCRKVLGK